MAVAGIGPEIDEPAELREARKHRGEVEHREHLRRAHRERQGPRPREVHRDGAGAAGSTAAAPQSAPADSTGLGARVGEVLFGRTGPRGGQHDGLVQAVVKTAVREIGANLGRQLVRGLLGGLVGGSTRRR